MLKLKVNTSIEMHGNWTQLGKHGYEQNINDSPPGMILILTNNNHSAISIDNRCFFTRKTVTIYISQKYHSRWIQ